ncbi:unnamed protein product [Periconia digitata]|uniref:C3H1-type domain-containing protein n=1 Tax=Periconia digitata TaxID=1303443 RepID=A0A9W4UD51_9PLEO|nr:unnamed protein product [Periconia digitata]
MSSFRFPPPPPPPPPAQQAPLGDTQHTYTSQRGGRGGRGDNGRGRGGSSRGRGGQGRGRPHNRGGGTRGGWQNQHHERAGNSQQHSFTPPPLSSNSVPSANPAAFAQAMSFMATPAGMQSMSAFASHLAGTNLTPILPQQSSPSRTNQPPSEQGTCKARRNERAMKWQADTRDKPVESNQKRNQKPPRAKAKAAPAVPSFGFSIPTAPQTQSALHRREDGQSDPKRRKLNLGLTQQQERVEDDDESASEEDIDEEAAWASNAKLKNGVVFEHEGERISLQTPAELAAWRKDRKKNFPTQQRVSEKAQEIAERRIHELEFLRKVSGRPKKGEAHDDKLPANTQRIQKDIQNRSGGSERELNNRRQKVHEIMKKREAQPASSLSNPPKIDLGLGYDTDTDAEESSAVSDSSVLSSDDSDSDSDDAPPSPVSSKIVVDTPVPPPVLAAARPLPRPKREQIDVCPQWKARGKCKYGRNCKYPHTSQPKIIGLYERLVEQELEKNDRVALDAIKFLGRNGFLG